MTAKKTKMLALNGMPSMSDSALDDMATDQSITNSVVKQKAAIRAAKKKGPKVVSADPRAPEQVRTQRSRSRKRKDTPGYYTGPGAGSADPRTPPMPPDTVY